MNESTRNSRQSGEHPVDHDADDPGDGPRLERVPVRDYVIAVALAVGLLLAILYLGGTVE